MVPKILAIDQNEIWMTWSGEFFDMADADSNFVKIIVTGDKTWCFL